jgi:two-component system chemotaxis response regulator CheY
MAKTILAVDDSVSMRQALSFTLRAAGYEVMEATDGTDAIARLTGPVDLVITDLNMPRMDGIELIKFIRSQSAHKFVPIMMLIAARQKRGREVSRRDLLDGEALQARAVARSGQPRAGLNPDYSFAPRRRSALPITETELNVMAALAIMGLSSSPNIG